MFVLKKKIFMFSLGWLLLGLTVSSCSLWGPSAEELERQKQQAQQKKQDVRFSALRNFEKGNIAYQNRDFQDAIDNYLKAIEMDRHTPEFYYNLGLAYYAVDKYEYALASYGEAIKLAPQQADSYYNMALVYNKLNNIDEAHKFYNKYQELMKQLAQAQAKPDPTPPPAPTQKTAKKPKITVQKPSSPPAPQ